MDKVSSIGQFHGKKLLLLEKFEFRSGGINWNFAITSQNTTYHVWIEEQWPGLMLTIW